MRIELQHRSQRKQSSWQQRIEEKSVVLNVKTGEGGKLFGSVSTKEIAAACEKQLGLEIDKKKMVLPEPIKACGTTIVPVKLHREVTAKLTVKFRKHKKHGRGINKTSTPAQHGGRTVSNRLYAHGQGSHIGSQ